MLINVKKLKENAVLPKYGSDFAAGADLHACNDEPITIPPHKTVMVGTGLAIMDSNICVAVMQIFPLC